MAPFGYFGNGSDLIALVTGAGSGIGRATAQQLAHNNIRRLVLTDRDAASLADTASLTGLAAEDILTASFDVADDAAWGEVSAQIRDRFGRLDLAVANAGISSGGLSIADLPFGTWRRVMSTNLDGVFLTVKHCMALIAEGGRGGALVVVSSALGIKPEIGTAAYATSKAAVRQLTKVAAKEGAPKKIRVNAILPGGTETALWNGVKLFDDLVAKTGSTRGAFDLMGASVPLGVYAQPEDIAGQIAFLLSDAAANITGAELLSDGGYAL